MQSYWELSERERAELTEEQVDELADYELMSAGVLRAKPLELIDEPPMPPPDATVYRLRVGYHDREVAWPSAEAAAESISGAAGKLDRKSFGDYPNQVSVHVVQPFEAKDSTLSERVEVYSEERLTQLHDTIEKAATARAENERLRKEYADALQKQQKALEGMWEDWRRCRAKAVEVRQVMGTLAEYTELVDGNRDLAMTFLGKAYDDEAIADAMAWSAPEKSARSSDTEGE